MHLTHEVCLNSQIDDTDVHYHTSVRLLREELQLLHEPGSYVGEVVKVMGKTKVLVKVQPEGKYSASFTIIQFSSKSSPPLQLLILIPKLTSMH